MLVNSAGKVLTSNLLAQAVGGGHTVQAAAFLITAIYLGPGQRCEQRSL